MNIKFNDATEVTALMVNGTKRFFQNAQRDSLEFVFAKTSYPFDTLDTYFADKAKTQKIVLTDDTGSQYVYDDYILRISMTLASVVVTPATSTTPEVTEERISIIMAQQTYLEKQVETLLTTP